MKTRALNLVVAAIAVDLLLILVVVATSPLVSSGSSDCDVVRQAGPMIWSRNLDGLTGLLDGQDVDHLRSVAPDCGYPQSMWLSTPTYGPTPTFSWNCSAESERITRNQRNPRELGTAVRRLNQCRAQLAATATATYRSP